MRDIIKKYIEQFNNSLNMPNICWWIIDFEYEPTYFYCNENMEEVFSLDKSLEKHSVADTCPIAGEYNKNIIDFDSSDNKAKTIFDDYKKLLSLDIETYYNTFPYYNSEFNKIEYFNSRAKILETDKNGKVSILMGIIEDVTLQETQKLQLQEAQSIAKVGSWSYDLLHYNFTYSDEVLNIFELDIIESLADVTKLIYDEDKVKVKAIHKESLINKKPYEVVYRLLLKGNKRKWIREQAKTIFNKSNEPLITVGTLQDITKEQEYYEVLKKKDKQLYESHKLTSMTEMIKNIAHQWRQPLSLISTLSSGTELTCNNEKYDLEVIKNNLNDITRITMELSETIDDFNALFKSDTECTSFIMEELIHKTLSMLKPKLNVNYTELKVENLSNCTISGSIIDYTQVLANLIENANDALDNVHQQNRIIKIRTEKINNVCTIQVEDNAGGISEDIFNRVFEPYFTTKHQSQGVGLGLYIAKEVVEKHIQGMLEVENIKNGTRFTIKIPNGTCKII